MDEDAIRHITERTAARGGQVEAGWCSYRLRVIPPGYDPADVDIMRIAFYAGALHLFSDLTARLADAGYRPPPALLGHIRQMSRELGNYIEDLNGGSSGTSDKL